MSAIWLDECRSESKRCIRIPRCSGGGAALLEEGWGVRQDLAEALLSVYEEFDGKVWGRRPHADAQSSSRRMICRCVHSQSLWSNIGDFAGGYSMSRSQGVAGNSTRLCAQACEWLALALATIPFRPLATMRRRPLAKV